MARELKPIREDERTEATPPSRTSTLATARPGRYWCAGRHGQGTELCLKPTIWHHK